MSDLRSRLIRLAAAKPELRADLLPLLKEDADPASVDQNKPEHYYGLPPKGIQASVLEFSDGVKFDLSGDYRVERRSDGYYVVGRGTTIPVDSRQEGEEIIRDLSGKKGRRAGTVTRTASRYELPGRAPGSMIAFGIDRAMGRYFQYWPNDEMPSLDKEFLDQGEVIDLLKKHGKPSSDLQKAVDAFAMDLDPGVVGVRGFSASTRRRG